MENFYLAALRKANGFTVRFWEKLPADIRDGKMLWDSSYDDLIYLGIPEKMATNIYHARKEHPDYPEKLANECEKKKINLVSWNDNNYPDILREIHQPPFIIFYRGNIEPEALRIAIVGSRRFTSYGKGVAQSFSQKLAAAGVTVVSGAARGIDTAAHMGALKGGRTVAVMGCGIDIAYPPENRKMLDEIAANGAVISEHEPGTPPLAQLFPARNRIISGLCKGTLVVEAAKRSGSLITAEFALSENRDVFAIPGSVFSDMSQGCHKLIQNGAKLVSSADDILEEYHIRNNYAYNRRKNKMPEMSEEESDIYKLLSFDKPMSVDEIIFAQHGRNDVSNISLTLIQMVVKGIIIEDDSHGYRRAERE